MGFLKILRAFLSFLLGFSEVGLRISRGLLRLAFPTIVPSRQQMTKQRHSPPLENPTESQQKFAKRGLYIFINLRNLISENQNKTWLSNWTSHRS